MILVDFIYLKVHFTQPFLRKDTEKLTFNLNWKESVEVEFMYQKSVINYAEMPELDAQVVSLKIKVSARRTFKKMKCFMVLRKFQGKFPLFRKL